MLQRQEKFECAPNKSSGLDLPHVLLAVEWLAKLHGLSYVAKRTFEKQNPQEDWLKIHPWIRKEIEDTSKMGSLDGIHIQGTIYYFDVYFLKFENLRFSTYIFSIYNLGNLI